MVAREQLQRDQRRPAHRRALILKPTPKQFDLLPETELANAPIGSRADAVVGRTRSGLKLLIPLGTKRRKLTLGASHGKSVGLSGGFSEIAHAPTLPNTPNPGDEGTTSTNVDWRDVADALGATLTA